MFAFFFPCYSTVAERAKLLRIYGPELFQEEAKAVEGMFRMLNYQQGIDMSQLTSEIGALREEDGPEDDHLSQGQFGALAKQLGDEGSGASASGGSTSAANGASDIYLPPFVRKALEEMLAAPDKESKHYCYFRRPKLFLYIQFTNYPFQCCTQHICLRSVLFVVAVVTVRVIISICYVACLSHFVVSTFLCIPGLQVAYDSVVRLVPDETRRRFYMRVFKWVIAFATWKFGAVRAHKSPSASGNVASTAGVTYSGTAPASASPGKNSRSAAGGPLAMVRVVIRVAMRH